jgi:hypothetical protein
MIYELMHMFLHIALLRTSKRNIEREECKSPPLKIMINGEQKIRLSSFSLTGSCRVFPTMFASYMAFHLRVQTQQLDPEAQM